MDTAQHRILIEERRGAEVTGVSDLLIFDENEIVMETTMGILTVHGLALHISSLDLERGMLQMEGEICEVYYEDHGKNAQTRKPGFFTKLLNG